MSRLAWNWLEFKELGFEGVRRKRCILSLEEMNLTPQIEQTKGLIEESEKGMIVGESTRLESLRMQIAFEKEKGAVF